MAPLWLLILDDNVADIQLLLAAFEDYPDVILTTYDQADAALHWLQEQVEQHHLPDLVLLDLHMPGMNGVKWLQIVRQHSLLQALPILLYSLAPVSQSLKAAEMIDVCGCWQKPDSFAAVQEQAEALWTIWQQDRQFTTSTLLRE